jgi:hypothetical protein
MEMILLCHACGHEELGDSGSALMLKIKMWNHVNKAHPKLVERFRDVVQAESVFESTREGAPNRV